MKQNVVIDHVLGLRPCSNSHEEVPLVSVSRDNEGPFPEVFWREKAVFALLWQVQPSCVEHGEEVPVSGPASTKNSRTAKACRSSL